MLCCTLRRRPEPSGGHEAVEGGTGDAGDLGDGGLGDAELEEVADLVLLLPSSRETPSEPFGRPSLRPEALALARPSRVRSEIREAAEQVRALRAPSPSRRAW